MKHVISSCATVRLILGSALFLVKNSPIVLEAFKSLLDFFANNYGKPFFRQLRWNAHFPYFTGAMFYTLQDTTSNSGRGQFIFPGCQEQYFWRLHRLPGYSVPHHDWTIVTADYINGTVHLYVDGHKVGWWPESDCSLNWYLKGENATSPDVLFFGNPATAPNAPGGWSEVGVDWFATFPGLPRVEPPL